MRLCEQIHNSGTCGIPGPHTDVQCMSFSVYMYRQSAYYLNEGGCTTPTRLHKQTPLLGKLLCFSTICRVNFCSLSYLVLLSSLKIQGTPWKNSASSREPITKSFTLLFSWDFFPLSLKHIPFCSNMPHFQSLSRF